MFGCVVVGVVGLLGCRVVGLLVGFVCWVVGLLVGFVCWFLVALLFVFVCFCLLLPALACFGLLLLAFVCFCLFLFAFVCFVFLCLLLFAAEKRFHTSIEERVIHAFLFHLVYAFVFFGFVVCLPDIGRGGLACDAFEQKTNNKHVLFCFGYMGPCAPVFY